MTMDPSEQGEYPPNGVVAFYVDGRRVGVTQHTLSYMAGYTATRTGDGAVRRQLSTKQLESNLAAAGITNPYETKWEHLLPNGRKIETRFIPGRSLSDGRAVDEDGNLSSHPSQPPKNAPATSEWSIVPGQSIIRKELHETYGGRRQGGVSPSAQSPNVMLFTDPTVGRLHGYNDGWAEDGCFLYTGEGQLGDQQMIQGNKAILESNEDDRMLRLFRGVGGAVTYLGRFRLDGRHPWFRDEAVESGGGDIRQVIVFRLVPDGTVVHDPAEALPPSTPEGMTIVPVENMNTEAFTINPTAESKEGERREQKLVLAYQKFMEAKGSTIVRTCCRPKGEAKPIFSDILDQTRRNLIEAKGSATRESVRMIIGQLADYERFVSNCTKAALLPEQPRPDLLALLESQNVGAVWRTEDGAFTDNRGGQFS